MVNHAYTVTNLVGRDVGRRALGIGAAQDGLPRALQQLVVPAQHPVQHLCSRLVVQRTDRPRVHDLVGLRDKLTPLLGLGLLAVQQAA